MKETYFWQITEYLQYDERQWPEFLITDCKEFVDTLHVYRLQHLIDNQEQFVDYMDVLSAEYADLLADEAFASQAQATVQALFTLSCVEFVSASKERMMIREMAKM